MEEDPLENKILDAVGEQPLHVRMIHRIINDRSDEDVTINQVQQRLDRLAEGGAIRKQGQNFETVESKN